MTARHLLRINPDALDPFEHNRIVHRRKTYRALARQFRAAGRTSHKAAASFRMLAVSADRAAESLRHFGRTMTAVGGTLPAGTRILPGPDGDR